MKLHSDFSDTPQAINIQLIKVVEFMLIILIITSDMRWADDVIYSNN